MKNLSKLDEYVQMKLKEIDIAVEKRDEYETPRDIVKRKIKEIVEELWIKT